MPTVGDAKLDNIPPGIIPLNQLVSKPVVQDQVLQVRVTLVCILDVIKEPSTDDAATLQVHSLLSGLLTVLSVLDCSSASPCASCRGECSMQH